MNLRKSWFIPPVKAVIEGGRVVLDVANVRNPSEMRFG